ncbi:MAG: hemagglutinin, partial [Betaproteobacteria bacterium]|nr:hemagglutinin [Betaproteobacteria bacterium]
MNKNIKCLAATMASLLVLGGCASSGSGDVGGKLGGSNGSGGSNNNAGGSTPSPSPSPSPS